MVPSLKNVETPSLNSGLLIISHLTSCQCPEILSEISSFVASDADTKCPNIFLRIFSGFTLSHINLRLEHWSLAYQPSYLAVSVPMFHQKYPVLLTWLENGLIFFMPSPTVVSRLTAILPSCQFPDNSSEYLVVLPWAELKGLLASH